MTKQELCGLCSIKVAEHYTLHRLPREANQKITCAICGKRRYGAVYELEKKEAAKG